MKSAVSNHKSHLGVLSFSGMCGVSLVVALVFAYNFVFEFRF